MRNFFKTILGWGTAKKNKKLPKEKLKTMNLKEEKKNEEEIKSQGVKDGLWIVDKRWKDSRDKRKILRDTEFVLSIGAQLDNKKIKIFTTGASSYIPKDKRTTIDDIKEILKKKGYTWDEKDSVWYIKTTDKNIDVMIKILRKYDSRLPIRGLGLVTCSECGNLKKPKEICCY